MKNSEARIKRFCKIAQPHIYVRFRGIGERPNKQENVGFRESGNLAFFVKWVPLCIACHGTPVTPRYRVSPVAFPLISQKFRLQMARTLYLFLN